MKKKIKNNKGPLCFLFAIIIAALLCIQAGAITVGTTNDKKDIYRTDFEKRSFDVTKLGRTSANTALLGNSLVSVDSQADDLEPAITKDQNGNIVVTWTSVVSILEAYLDLGYSQDSGSSWNAIQVTLEGLPMHSDVAYVHGSDFEGGGDFNGLWGVYGDLLNNQAGFYRIADITDDSTYEFYSWTTEYEDTAYCAISDNTWYNEFNYDVTGPTNMYIYHEVYDVYDIPSCPTHWYSDGALEAGGVGYFDGQSELLTAPAFDPDMACIHDSSPAQTSNDYVLLTWQYDDPDTGHSAIVLKKIVPEEEPDIEYTPYQWYIAKEDLSDAAHPNIGASGHNAVVVYMANDNIYGDWDIKCLYSSDDGMTWSTSTVVATPQVDETYPAVFMSGSTAFCVYISQGNLYVITSKDGGVTWDTPTQVNDVDGSVVNEENSADIHSAGIVWTDNRNGNLDIYYAPLSGGPNIPSRPDGPTSVRKNRQQTYTTTTTDPAGGQVYYLFDWGDGTDSGWLGPFASGATGNGRHAWSEDGNYQIKVKAKNENGDESAWSEPLPISVPRNKPTFSSLLLKLLEQFKILEFILK